jgi:hypothetical protein
LSRITGSATSAKILPCLSREEPGKLNYGLKRRCEVEKLSGEEVYEVEKKLVTKVCVWGMTCRCALLSQEGPELLGESCCVRLSYH